MSPIPPSGIDGCSNVLDYAEVVDDAVSGELAIVSVGNFDDDDAAGFGLTLNEMQQFYMGYIQAMFYWDNLTECVQDNDRETGERLDAYDGDRVMTAVLVQLGYLNLI